MSVAKHLSRNNLQFWGVQTCNVIDRYKWFKTVTIYIHQLDATLFKKTV
jgi:hypothetical protein